jgi:hypothetical protein
MGATAILQPALRRALQVGTAARPAATHVYGLWALHNEDHRSTLQVVLE